VTGLVFLLGSGISIPDGMPSVKCITDELMSPRDVPIDSEQRYTFDPGAYRMPFQKMADEEITLIEHAAALAEGLGSVVRSPTRKLPLLSARSSTTFRANEKMQETSGT
jgi:hypothetical protein